MPNNDNGTYIWDVDHNEWKNLGNFIGEQGAKGDKGDTGDTGATGPQGPAGTTPDISVSASVSNTTGTPAVTVTKGGTTAAPTFALAFSGIKGETGPQGPTGATGAQGPKGDTGDTGATGATGPKGDKGDTGETGPQGPQGLQGPTGATGPKGDTGATGPAGPTGPQGPKGDEGEGTLWWQTTGTFDPLTDVMNIPTSRIISFAYSRERDPADGDYLILNASNLYEIIRITTVQGVEVAQSMIVATINGDFPPYQFSASASIGTNDPTQPPTATATVSEHGLQRNFNFVFNNIKGPKGDTGAQGPTGATGATGAKGDMGIGMPAGGTTGQMLYKVSNTSYDFGWKKVRELPSSSDTDNGKVLTCRDNALGASLAWETPTNTCLWNDTFDGSTGINNKVFQFSIPSELQKYEISSVEAYVLWDTAVAGYSDIMAGYWYPLNGLTLAGNMISAGYKWKLASQSVLNVTLTAGMAPAIYVVGTNVISTWSSANRAQYIPNDGNGHVRLRVIATFGSKNGTIFGE